jgi:LCP family protein required for cell wall assembly
MSKKIGLAALVVMLFVSSCASTPEVASISSYYLVTAAPDASATPTPFQPLGELSKPVSQVDLPYSSPTIPPPAETATPFPTASPAPISQPTPEISYQPLPAIDAAESITFLLLGSDTSSGSSFRTDTILVAAVRPNDGQVSLISFPRDLWVNIPTVGMQRINTAYEFGEMNGYPGGGAGLLKDTILFNFGLKIDHTAMIDFDGFRKVVDTLGGVDVPVYCPYTDWRLLDPSYDPQNENNWFLYTAEPGLSHMNGDLALWYARSRKKSNDFDRGRRQQEVLRSIYAQALRTDSITRIPKLYSDLSSSFTTDLGLADILKLSPMGLHLTNADIRSYYIAGDLVTSWITPGGAYVLLPNNDPIREMLNQALSSSPRQQEREKTKIEVQNGSPSDGWDSLAAERLNYAGFQTSLKPADNRLHANSLLYDLTPDQDRNRTASLLSVLGLPESALVSAPSKDSKVSYALIVGADYKTCFSPAGLAP